MVNLVLTVQLLVLEIVIVIVAILVLAAVKGVALDVQMAVGEFAMVIV